jgi:methylenetetrahydrofolate dehydrogenase (NADP+) / methenyltetrahydrofolate cyclohydrolase
MTGFKQYFQTDDELNIEWNDKSVALHDKIISSEYNTHMTKIIDGNALAQKRQNDLCMILQAAQDEVAFSSEIIRKPTVVSFCNVEDPPSVKYTYMKLKKAEEIGIDFVAEDYDTNTPKEELEAMIQKYNEDPEVDGIMVQLPLPPELQVIKDDLLELITPTKDVDGLTLAGQEWYDPATVLGVITILDEYCKGWKNKVIGVVGSEGEVGRPLVRVLNAYRVKEIREIDLEIGDIKVDLKECDIVISSTGVEDLIKPEMIKNDAVLIDVGLGDIDAACYEKASLYTPKVGGVGPMTVISLMENVVQAYINSLP